MKTDAVFEGGGVKGIGFVGAICYLEEVGFSWERLAGTSAGSIVASLLAVGYSGVEIKNIVLNMNYSNLLSKRHNKFVPNMGKYISLIKTNGFYSGDELEKFFHDLFEVKGKTKFKDVTVNGKCRLKIIAADITKRDILILPDDLSRYGIDPMNFSLAKAVRMSISIPLFFKPVTINYDYKKSFVVDGGIISNYPIWIFDSNTVPRWPTFGFKFQDSSMSNSQAGKTDIISFILDVLDTVVDKKEERYIIAKDKVRSIEIDALKVKSTNFDISKEKATELFNSGYASAKEFISSWDFNEYIKKYRIK